MKKLILTSLSLLLVFSFASVVSAQQASGTIMGAEYQFLEQAAQDNMYEVRAAQLAADRATNPQVKQFAQKLIDDHSQVGDQLRQLAAEHNMDLPDTISMGHQENINNLYQLSGQEFDQTYMEQMVESHQKNVNAFQKMANEADDPTITNFAASTVPELETHLAEARKIHNQLELGTQ